MIRNFNIDKFREEVEVLTSSPYPEISGNEEWIKAAKEALKVLKSLDGYNNTFKRRVFNALDKFSSTGLLSPLTLEDSDFVEGTVIGGKVHKRCKRVYKDTNGICDVDAWRPKVMHVYDVVKQQEIEHSEYAAIDDYPIPCKGEIVITKGGVCTNLTIQRFYLREGTILYTPIEPIKLPVSIIADKDTAFYCMDSREPALTALIDEFDANYVTDNYYKSLYDIRKFKKLK